MDKTRFLKKVDDVCIDCNYGEDGEQKCAVCPIRANVDAVNRGLREAVRIETAVFNADYAVDGKVVIEAGQQVTIVDAAPDPERGETMEDMDGYCDVVDENGNHICQGVWNDFEGFYDPTDE